MPEIKVVVLYPTPTDADAFDQVYMGDHVDLCNTKMKGVATRYAVTKLGPSPMGANPFHLMWEGWFPDPETVQAFFSSPDGQEVAGHAVSISSGGPPVVMTSTETEVTL